MARGWSRPLGGFAAEVERTLGRQQKEMVLFALHQLINYSPVDSGAYRGSHFVTINRRNNIRDTQGNERSAMEAMGEAERIMEASLGMPFKRVYIQSNIVYGEKIERGHSRQAPGGVYAVAGNDLAERYGR